MSLVEYRRKRDFRVTSEPKGAKPQQHEKLQFVIQKHAASHLHYDFRLELDGVLKSWAVPKGPSLDPAVRRLAMQVEDHPLEYGDFEGIIPKGEYGGGTVMLWDKGTWEPLEDGQRSYDAGSLKFVLHGEKLQGGWMLVRRGGRSAAADERHWFLFKERDRFASTAEDVTVDKPLSVTTGRDLDDIAARSDRVWTAKGEVKHERVRKGTGKYAHAESPKVSAKAKRITKQGRSRSARGRSDRVPSLPSLDAELKKLAAKKATLPKCLEVQLATLIKEAPDGEDWLHEIKFDGYRMLCRIEKGKVRFISRNGKDWTTRFRTLGEAARELPVESAIIDGEVVVIQPNGTTSFQALQNALNSPRSAKFSFYCFDLLYLNGFDVRQVAIEDRKRLLSMVVPTSGVEAFKFSEHVIGNGPEFFAAAVRMKLEGIISKRSGQPYVSGRGMDWLKIKSSLREEFVIGGFSAPTKSRTHFGALLLGYYDKRQELVYSGRVGTGFDQRSLGELHAKFLPLVHSKSPFANLSGTTGQARDVTWLKPSLVAQVEFSNWTNDGMLRHPSFQGLREDKPAAEVVRDNTVSAPVIESASEAQTMAKRRSSARKRTTSAAANTSHAGEGSEVAGVVLSHPDKILYPEEEITKLEIAQYYEQAARWMLPHTTNRLLTLVRCPAGSNARCFYQKHPGEGTSEHLRRFDVREKAKTEEYLAFYDLEGVISLVQMGVLEIHLWGSQADEFEKPDRLIFDLDPDPSVVWPQVITAAKEVRLLLKELGLVSFVKTTGGKGLHVVVPIRRRVSWDEAKTFCHEVADFLVAAAPNRYVAKMSKSLRKGKIFVDYLRNDRGATSVAPYSTRARAGAPVSVPVDWKELTPRLTSDHFNIRNLPSRFAKLKKDPWSDIFEVEQTITAAMLRKLKISR